MEVTRSKFEFYSWAIAAQNKHLDTDEIYATPIEVTPFMDGELDARIEEVEGSGEDHNEQTYTVKVKKDNAVMATWLPLHNTNRRTSPDIRRGERVLLYRMADSERFYWVSLGMDDYLRRLETVIYSWSATDREEDDATDPEFCYSLEVCTHTRQVTFRTVKGIDYGGKGTTEPYAYTLQFNTDYGSVVLTDDVGNYFQLDSPETCITFENKDGTYTHWDKENIFMFAPNNIDIHAENDIYLKADNNYRITVGNDMSTEVGNNKSINVGNNFSTVVSNNRSLTVGGLDTTDIKGSATASVGGDLSNTVQGSVSETVGGDRNSTVSGSHQVNVSGSSEVSAGSQHKASVGGSSITVTSGNITFDSGSYTFK